MKQILLIEPDYILASTYKRALETSEYKLSVCATAQAAITLADKKLPDLVILELQLVEHSGIEFLYEFRSYQEWQTIPVLVHTQVPPGEFFDSWEILKDELGVRAYLYKPLTSLRTLVKQAQLLTPIKSETAAH